MQFLFKSTNNSWRYERKCEWVFFSGVYIPNFVQIGKKRSVDLGLWKDIETGFIRSTGRNRPNNV